MRGAPPQEAARARVRALGVLTDHHEVVARRGEGPQVDVEVQLEAHLEQQAPLDDPGRDVGSADRAHVQRVEGPPFRQSVVVEHRAVPQVAVAAEVVVGGVQVHARGRDHLQALGHNLRADPVASDDSYSMCHL